MCVRGEGGGLLAIRYHLCQINKITFLSSSKMPLDNFSETRNFITRMLHVYEYIYRILMTKN